MKNNPVAFIIGNGPSRKPFDLGLCMGHGQTYGCNALYRTFQPDWLVAIDTPIIEEILSSMFPKDRFFVPPYDEQFEPAEAAPHRPRMNAGMVAMKLAIEHGAKVLYCLGFDFIIASPEGMDNIFAGTPCYGKDTAATFQDHIGRSKFLKWFMNKNPDIDFRFVVADSVRETGLNAFDIQTPNLSFLTVSDLTNTILTLNGK